MASEAYFKSSSVVVDMALAAEDASILGAAEDGIEHAESAFRNTEANLWQKQATSTDSALSFWHGFLGLRKGAGHATPLTPTDIMRLRQIIRAVSWVESKHGSAGVNEPKRDPMQCGNPKDAWWRELTGQTTQASYFIRGPGLNPDYSADNLPAAVANVGGFAKGARISALSNKRNGHRDTNYSKLTSYYWGIPYLLHRTNTKAGRKTYQCGALSRSDLVRGAVAYNGGGDPNYEKKIEAALKLIGDVL